MDNGKKNSLKVLTTNDIRTHARDWTLAGDVGLLAHLEQFSERIINKTEETQSNFNELVDNYEELYTKVGNITNQFLALQNCQFVENRVYDEETPTEEKQEVKVQNEADQEKLLLMQYKEAVEVGIKLLDTHFQEVQLPPNSDSDEEDDVSTGNSIIWKPKNPYASKKFPLLIGSSEWWADDNVGLRPNKESFDTERIISESESDMESLKSIEKTMKSSSSSSSMENIKSIPIKPTFMESTEDLFGFDKNEIMKTSNEFSKGSNSLLEESSNFVPDFDKEPEIEVRKKDDSSDEQQQQQPNKQIEENAVEEEISVSKPKKVDNEFTRELMAKLVSVTNKTENGEGVEEKKKKKKEKVAEVPTIKPKVEEDSLFDETDDSNDLFSAKITRASEKAVDEGKKKGLFFEENDDELFKGENDLFSGSSLFESDDFKKPESQPVGKNDLGIRREPKPPEKKEGTPPKKNLVNDLFEDLDDDEDTLFAPKTVNHKPLYDKSSVPMEKEKPKEGKASTPPGFVWDNDEGLFDSINTKVDHDFFNSSGLFDDKPTKVDSKKNDTKTDLPSKEPDQSVIKPENNKMEESSSEKEASLFDSVKDEDPFGFSTSKDSAFKKISILDMEEDDDDDDLFSKGFSEEKKPPQVKAITVTESGNNNNEEDDDDTALFTEKPKPSDSVSVSSSRSSLFDDVSASKSRLASVFEKDKPTKTTENIIEDSKPGRDLFAGGKGKEEKSSLFDDFDDDDLFSVGTKTETKQKSTGGNKKQSFLDDLEDNDLFKSVSSPTKLRGTKSDILRHSQQKLFADDSPDGDLFADKTKPKPPSSLSLKPKTETEKKGQTVGKLNIPDNLKMKFESVAKKISPGGGKPKKEEKGETKEEVEKKEEKGERKEEQREKKKEEEVKVLDDGEIQPSALLKCPSKDRVKIPGKRRPQSRKARQEAIRNSGNWDLTSNTTSAVPQQGKETSPVVSNPLSPSTDEEDFFKVPELDKNFEKEDQSIFKSDLFESSKCSKLDDNLLFDGAPVLSPLTPKKEEESVEKPVNTPETETLFGSTKGKTVSIFDDDDFNGDDDESLFKTTSKSSKDGQTPQKIIQTSSKTVETPPKTTQTKMAEISKKPLFDLDIDDDDEDDLFGGKHTTPSKVKPQETKKEGGEPKDKGNSNFVDPLGLISNDQ